MTVEAKEQTDSIEEVEETPEIKEEAALEAEYAVTDEEAEDLFEEPAKEDAPVDKEAEDKEEAPQGDESKTEIDLSNIADMILDRANALGLMADEIKELSDNGGLAKTIDILEKRVSDIGRGKDSGQDPDTNTPEGEEAEGKPSDAEEFKLDEEFNEENYDPVIVNTVKGIKRQFEDKLEAIKGSLGKEVEELQGYIKQQMEDKVTVEIDEIFNSVDDALKGDSFLGKGNLAQIKPGSEAAKNRIKILNEMDVLVAGYNKSGLKVPDTRSLFESAKSIVFGDKLKEIVRKELTSKVEKRSKSYIHRPSNKRRLQHHDTNEKKAVEAAAEFLKSKGIIGTDDDEDFDEF